jgi:hypothetical protein
MSHTIPAVLNNGVFRPLEPIDLPEGTRAQVIPLAEPTLLPRAPSTTWPDEYFEQTAGTLAGEPFERSPQGDLPNREDW